MVKLDSFNGSSNPDRHTQHTHATRNHTHTHTHMIVMLKFLDGGLYWRNWNRSFDDIFKNFFRLNLSTKL